MKKKIFSFLFALTLASSLMSIAPQYDEEVDCATVYTVCDTAFPDDFLLFERCMVNNGCGGDDGGNTVISQNP